MRDSRIFTDKYAVAVQHSGYCAHLERIFALFSSMIPYRSGQFGARRAL
jgi:hypothetical protein